VWGYREQDPLGGKDPYSASKACAELVAASYRATLAERGNGVLIANARGGNIIGGGDWSADRIVPDFVRAVATRQPTAQRLVLCSAGRRLCPSRTPSNSRRTGIGISPRVPKKPRKSRCHRSSIIEGPQGAMSAASLLVTGAMAMRKDDEPWLVGSPDLLRSELGWQPTIMLEDGRSRCGRSTLPPGPVLK
jgi:hypothetical protein